MDSEKPKTAFSVMDEEDQKAQQFFSDQFSDASQPWDTEHVEPDSQEEEFVKGALFGYNPPSSQKTCEENLFDPDSYQIDSDPFGFKKKTCEKICDDDDSFFQKGFRVGVDVEFLLRDCSAQVKYLIECEKKFGFPLEFPVVQFETMLLKGQLTAAQFIGSILARRNTWEEVQYREVDLLRTSDYYMEQLEYRLKKQRFLKKPPVSICAWLIKQVLETAKLNQARKIEGMNKQQFEVNEKRDLDKLIRQLKTEKRGLRAVSHSQLYVFIGRLLGDIFPHAKRLLKSGREMDEFEKEIVIEFIHQQSVKPAKKELQNEQFEDDQSVKKLNSTPQSTQTQNQNDKQKCEQEDLDEDEELTPEQIMAALEESNSDHPPVAEDASSESTDAALENAINAMIDSQMLVEDEEENEEENKSIPVAKSMDILVTNDEDTYNCTIQVDLQHVTVGHLKKLVIQQCPQFRDMSPSGFTLYIGNIKRFATDIVPENATNIRMER